MAGFGLGALLGAVAGVLLARRHGSDTREQVAAKLKAMKAKSEDWMAEQKAKRKGAAESN